MCSSQVVTNVYCACGCIFFLSLCKKEFNSTSAVISFSYLSFYSYIYSYFFTACSLGKVRLISTVNSVNLEFFVNIFYFKMIC